LGEYELGIIVFPYKLGGSKAGAVTNSVNIPDISLSKNETEG
jgi:hypothetical protein